MAATVTSSSSSHPLTPLVIKYSNAIDSAIAAIETRGLIAGKTLMQLTNNRISFHIGTWTDAYESSRPYVLCCASIALRESTTLLDTLLKSPGSLSVTAQQVIKDCCSLLKESIPVATVVDGWLLSKSNVSSFASGSYGKCKPAKLNGEEITCVAEHLVERIKKLAPGQRLHCNGGSYLHASQILIQAEPNGYVVTQYDTEHPWNGDANGVRVLHFGKDSLLLDSRAWALLIKDRITKVQEPDIAKYFVQADSPKPSARFPLMGRLRPTRQGQDNCHYHSITAMLKHQFIRKLGPQVGLEQYKLFKLALSKLAYEKAADGLPADLRDYSSYVIGQRQRYQLYNDLPYEECRERLLKVIGEFSKETAERSRRHIERLPPFEALNFLHTTVFTQLRLRRDQADLSLDDLEADPLLHPACEKYRSHDRFVKSTLDVVESHLAYDASMGERFAFPMREHPPSPKELSITGEFQVERTLADATLSKEEVIRLLAYLPKIQLFPNTYNSLLPPILCQALNHGLQVPVITLFSREVGLEVKQRRCWARKVVETFLCQYRRIMARDFIKAYGQLDSGFEALLWKRAPQWAQDSETTKLRNFLEVMDLSKAPEIELRRTIVNLRECPRYWAERTLETITQALPDQSFKIKEIYTNSTLDDED